MPNWSTILLTLFLLFRFSGCFPPATSQEPEVDDQLTANRRLFTPIGPGLRALRRGADGKYYVLATPAAGLVVFDAQGKQRTVIGAPPAESAATKPDRPAIASGEGCDVDAQAHMYVVDRGSNLVHEFSLDGRLLHSIPVPAPLAVAALPDGEVGVATLAGT